MKSKLDITMSISNTETLFILPNQPQRFVTPLVLIYNVSSDTQVSPLTTSRAMVVLVRKENSVNCAVIIS